MIEDIVRRLMEKHRIDEMAMDRSDAIAVCMRLGSEFIEHFHKIYEGDLSAEDLDHHCGELQGWYKRIKRIVLSYNKKNLNQSQLKEWFFYAGSSLEVLFSDSTEAMKYESFIEELLSDDTRLMSDIIEDVLSKGV